MYYFLYDDHNSRNEAIYNENETKKEICENCGGIQMHSAEPDGQCCVLERPLGGAYRPVKKTLFHGALDTSLYRI